MVSKCVLLGTTWPGLQTVEKGHPSYRKASFLLGRVFADQGLHTLAVERFLTAIDGREMSPAEVLAELNRIGGENGIGRADIVVTVADGAVVLRTNFDRGVV